MNDGMNAPMQSISGQGSKKGHHERTTPQLHVKHDAVFEPVDIDPLKQDDALDMNGSVPAMIDSKAEEVQRYLDEHNERVEQYLANHVFRDQAIQRQMDRHNAEVERFINDKHSVSIVTGETPEHQQLHDATFWNKKRDEQRQYRSQIDKIRQRENDLITAGEQRQWKARLLRRAAFDDDLQLETWLQQLGLRPAKGHRTMIRQLAGVNINIFDLLENRFLVHPTREAMIEYSKAHQLEVPRKMTRGRWLRQFLIDSKQLP